MLETVKQLSDIERRVLSSIDTNLKDVDYISELTGLNADSVRRAFAWLNQKNLAKLEEIEEEQFVLTNEGEKALNEGMPENIFLEKLTEMGREASFEELMKKTKLERNAFTAALGINKRKAFITINGGKIIETGVAKEQETFDLRNSLRDIVDKNKVDDQILKELLNRTLIEKKLTKNRKIIITKSGEEAKKLLAENKVERVYDIYGEVPRINIGKRAPYIQFLNQIRSKLVSLGFNEMPSPLTVSEFYNFDVLFQPQNHPARTWTDTYQLRRPKKASLPDKKKVDAIKRAHEDGGVSKSSGWGYKWDPSIAAKLMPTAHGTAHSARQLVEGVKIPNKYFAIARCFRPDVLDATHLIEFNQMEGFVVGEDLNFKHLLGMLKEFAIEIAGAEKVKFFPDYYPFTEPSVQLSAKHPEMGWIEFAGAGMFRPEMLENLGIKGQAIAWGVGIDRLAMFKLGIDDIRYLFAEDLDYIRGAKGVLV